MAIHGGYSGLIKYSDPVTGGSKEHISISIDDDESCNRDLESKYDEDPYPHLDGLSISEEATEVSNSSTHEILCHLEFQHFIADRVAL